MNASTGNRHPLGERAHGSYGVDTPRCDFRNGCLGRCTLRLGHSGPHVDGEDHLTFEGHMAELAKELSPEPEKEPWPSDELKPAINNLVWMFAPGTITLDRADKLACDIYELILAAGEET